MLRATHVVLATTQTTSMQSYLSAEVTLVEALAVNTLMVCPAPGAKIQPAVPCPAIATIEPTAAVVGNVTVVCDALAIM